MSPLDQVGNVQIDDFRAWCLEQGGTPSDVDSGISCEIERERLGENYTDTVTYTGTSISGKIYRWNDEVLEFEVNNIVDRDIDKYDITIETTDGDEFIFSEALVR